MTRHAFFAAAALTLIAVSGCGGSDETVGPSCTDGILNGTEAGVDCGGSCAACPGIWLETAAEQNGGAIMPYDQYTIACPAHGEVDSIWGSDIYTDDSSVCTAAVHAGVITGTTAQNVTIEIWPAQDAYAATTRHGITSLSYGSWWYSFVFVPVSTSIPKCTVNSLQNGTETGVDCGRDCATKCAAGEVCYGNADCASNSCDVGATYTCN